MTVTLKVQDAVRPDASVTVQLTVVWPSGNVLPEAGVTTSATTPHGPVTSGSLNVTTAPTGLPSRNWGEDQYSAGKRVPSARQKTSSAAWALAPPVREAQGATLSIDQATRANLELVRTLGGERKGSLLAAIDRTVTAAGSRLMAQRLAAPLTDPAAIDRRLDAVQVFVTDPAARAETRSRLNAAPDLARALTRLVVGRGGPRDLAAIRDGIAAASGVAVQLDALADKPVEISNAIAALRRPDPAIAKELAAALAEELPLLKRDGGFVREGYVPELDESRALRDESRKVIAQLQG